MVLETFVIFEPCEVPGKAALHNALAVFRIVESSYGKRPGKHPGEREREPGDGYRHEQLIRRTGKTSLKNLLLKQSNANFHASHFEMEILSQSWKCLVLRYHRWAEVFRMRSKLLDGDDGATLFIPFVSKPSL